MTTVHLNLTEAQAKAHPSRMLDYTIVVRDKKGKFVEAARYEGYSGHAMWDVEDGWRNQYPRDKGFTIEW